MLKEIHPDSQLEIRVQALQIYMRRSHLNEDLRRTMMLYPLDLTIEQQFYGKKNLAMTDISASLLEFEVSFK